MLIALTIAWSLGLLAGIVLDPPFPVLAWAGLWALGGGFLAGRDRAARRLAVLGLAFTLGAWRWQAAQPHLGPGDLAAYNDGAPVTIEGYLSAPPQPRGTYAQLEITAERVTLGAQSLAVEGKVLVNAMLFPSYAYGERIRCTGTLETPPILEDFNYREYLASRGIHSLMRRAALARLPGYGGSPLLRVLYRFRQVLQARIEALLPHPEAGLLQGLLLGLDHTLPTDLAEAFRQVGLTHLLVVSGYNVSLLLQAWFLASRRRLHRWTSLWLGMGWIILFASMAGLSPPVMRAGLMGILFVLAQRLGRRAHPLTSLAATALLMTVWNPFLLHSVSYQLSLAATLAMILIQPRLAARLYRWWPIAQRRPGLGVLMESLTTSLAAQMATLPILAAHFRQVSTVAPLANVLVAPLQPFLLAAGVTITLLSLPLPGLARGLAYALWLPLRWMVWVARTLASLPWASLALPQGTAWAFYGLLLLIFWFPAPKTKPPLHKPNWKPFLLPAACALGAVLLGAAASTLPDGRLHIHALDVGQGDAFLIQTPHGHSIAIDGGPDPVLFSARLGEKLPFWQRRIALAIATHPDGDHLTGLIPLAQRYAITLALQGPWPARDPLAEAWHTHLAQAGVAQMTLHHGTVVAFDGIMLRILYPTEAEALALDENQASLVMLLEYGTFRMLFTGDIDALTEARLLNEEKDLQAAVLKVSHHGAGNASTEAFLERVAPKWCIISVGTDNRYGHPAPQALQRLEAVGCQILRTDEKGTITLSTDGERLWIQTER